MATEAQAHPHPNYMAVFYGLFAITVLEVGVTYLDISQWLMIVTLLAMAFVKAAMVAAYFMHLRYDNIVLSIVCDEAGRPTSTGCDVALLLTGVLIPIET